MQGLSGAQLWYENNFLLCEASVNLGITEGKNSKSIKSRNYSFFLEGGAGGGGVRGRND